jgi:tripartite-type tricarboxylate transporter receptor subunit TctC
VVHAFARVALLAVLCLHGLAWPQAFPTRTVRIVIPFPPGGTSDILARTLAQKLTEEWGQQVIAENRPGAAGNVACEFVAKQKGDPHTLLINTVGTHAINPAIYPNLPFDPPRRGCARTPTAPFACCAAVPARTARSAAPAHRRAR